MIIQINGEKREFEKDVTLLDVIKRLGVEEKVMAAALNMEIVKKEKWADTRLKEGDRLELLDFVGGG